MLELGYDFMAENQYGEKVFLKGKYPRKALLEHCDRKSASKMYIGTMDGKSHHIGYICGGFWWNIYNVSAWEGGI